MRALVRGVLATVVVLFAASTAAPALARPPAPTPSVVQRADGRFLGIVHSRSGRHGAAPAARAAAPTQMTYHGGPVQHSSRVYAIFWVPPSYSLPGGYRTLVTRYFDDVAHDSFKTSNVYASDTQYFDRSHGVQRFESYATSFATAVLDTHALPADGCANYLLADGSTSKDCLTDAQLTSEIKSVVAAHGFPSGLGVQYFLFTPQGLASCFDATALASGGCYDPFSFDGFCAYHSAVSGPLLYANMPFASLTGCFSDESPNGNAADDVLNVTSHEHNETMTDPLGNAWFDSNGNENGDKCAFDFGAAVGSTSSGRYNQVINGHPYWLQQEWSNRKHGCAQRNTFLQPTASFTATPAHPARGAKVKFTSTAHDGDDTAFTYRWTLPDNTTSTVPNPTHAFATAGDKRVSLVVFDAHGDQVRVVHTVSVG